MANKIIIGILIVLMILMGGTGYYSYTLSQQINDLGNQFTTFETEQTARADAVNGELMTLRRETQSSINTLEGKITATLAEIDTIKAETGATQNQVAGLEDKIGGVTSQITTLEDRLTSAVAEFSRSALDANAVYEKVSQAVVRISNGQNTAGSGFIFNTQAHVLTAYHVVANLSPIYVALHDGRIYKATTIGYCTYSDIAVLKLDGTPNIKPLALADSSKVIVGEPVVAIGSPGNPGSTMELRDTLTAGIVSQFNRYENYGNDTESRWVANLIQFDAAVNFGNSGGPLINADGEVVGIVVARIDPAAGDGIYWAVSSNKAKRVATGLIAHGFYDYPWIGVGMIDLTPQIVRDRALETANGVLVTTIFDNSPAKTAGIKADDIIISVDDTPARDTADLTSYLGEFKSPGDNVTIGLIRGTARLKLDIKVGTRQ
jgi:putative serine protease PepD